MAGSTPKLIEEFIGRLNIGMDGVSIARMRSPTGWSEPGQTPEFDEFTVGLTGTLRVAGSRGIVDVQAGQAIVAHRGEWVQYSTPEPGGVQYLAVCVPVFSADTVHRDA